MAESDELSVEHESGRRELRHRAVRGAFVTMAAQGSKIVLQFLSVILLSRVLSPGDYGLVAMIMSVVSVADIFRDFGLSSAAIQAKTLTRPQQHNLFWVNAGLGLALFAAIVVVAPLIAAIFHEPVLVDLTRVVGLVFLLNGMATQYRADLTRRLRFRSLALADVLSPAVALASALLLAWSGAGYWALVAQQVLQVAVMLAAVAIAARWLPRGYHKEESIRPFLNFGWRLAGSQLINYVGNNVDSFSLGRWFGAQPLGLYNRSYQLIMTPLQQVRGPLNSVAVPLLSRFQDDDDRFYDYVARAQIAMGYTIVVGLAMVAGVTGPLVRIFLGDQWHGAAPLLTLLCCAGGFTTLSYVGYWVYVTKGLMNHLLQYSFISTGIRVTLVALGLRWGVVGVAGAMAVAPMIAWPLSFWWLSLKAAIPVRRLWSGGVRVVLVSVLAGVASLAASVAGASLPDVVRVTLSLVGGLAVVSVGGLVVPIVRQDLRSIVKVAKGGLAR